MHHRLTRRLLALLALSLTFITHGFAQEELLRKVYNTQNNTWVEVTSVFGKLPSHGYAPIRVRSNNGTQKDLQINLSFKSSDDEYHYNNNGNSMRSTFSCTAPAGRTSSFELLVPISTVTNSDRYNTGSNLDVTVMPGAYQPAEGSMFSENTEEWPAVIMSNKLYITNSSSLDSHLNSTSSHRSGDLEFAGSFNPKTLPSDWRAYQGQDVVMMTSENWRATSPGARLAILEWNRLGGRIIIYAENSTEDLATLHIDKNMAGKRKTVRSLGTIRIVPLPTSERLNEVKTEKLIRAEALDDSSQSSIINTYSHGWPLLTQLGEKHFSIILFIIILLAFGILVGPINLFVFAKSGKRHKLFITTPIISLVASVIMIILILFQDGFGGKGHRISIMEIQPDENKAYITQTQIARTGVLLSNSFETSEPVAITPLALKSSRWSRVTKNGKASNAYELNHTESGVEASGDWFQSRSIHGHLLQTIRPSRSKLELIGSSEKPSLSSTFEFDLGLVYYQDSNNQWWKTSPLKKGVTTPLSKVDKAEFSAWFNAQKKNFAHTNSKKLDRLSLSNNRFYTITENAKALETTKAIKWLTTKTFITGEL